MGLSARVARSTAICGIFGVCTILTASPSEAAVPADAPLTAVVDAAELNEVVDKVEVELALEEEHEHLAQIPKSSESGKQRPAEERLRSRAESELENDADSSAAEAAEDRQDATEAVQEQQQGGNGPQG
ncbi:MAG TPA: hypothetical protein VGN43_03745 [Steroidobacteraceae bacterium]|jgi:hypothetical protein|nr:hypothetical protein [Steroidobacteraceae bacterium]